LQYLATSVLAATAPALGGWHVLLRLVVAAGLGAVVGFEREIRDREAGIRTHLLVSLGAGLFTIVSAFGFHEFLTSGDAVVRADPTRIAAQIVTGIGFLGAGAIIREGLSVRGLTTAGSLWVVAAIGMAAGAGYYWAAVVATFLTIFALWPLRILSYKVIERMKPEENRLIVELREGQEIGPFLAQLHDVRHFELTDEVDRRLVQLELPHIDEQLVARLSDLDYVIGIRWRR
jgi:putative Mg2+ transporter-C (MgtC) family protein